MVNHFQKVLNCFIDEVQSAFVLVRLITLAYEILEVFKMKRYGMKRQFTLEFDMSKAYNKTKLNVLCLSSSKLIINLETKGFIRQVNNQTMISKF